MLKRGNHDVKQVTVSIEAHAPEGVRALENGGVIGEIRAGEIFVVGEVFVSAGLQNLAVGTNRLRENQGLCFLHVSNPSFLLAQRAVCPMHRTEIHAQKPAKNRPICAQKERILIVVFLCALRMI